MKRYMARSVAGLIFALTSSLTLANSIEIANDWDGNEITKGGAPWTATCTSSGGGNCMFALLGPDATWNDSVGSGYFNNGNPQSELDILNDLLGNSGEDLITGTEDIAGATDNVTVNYKYFAIKQSNYVIYFENLEGAGLDVGFDRNFSHATGFGEEIPPVPLPAGAWLFGSALLGLVGWRRKASKAAS